jgi:hypothetical protein
MTKHPNGSLYGDLMEYLKWRVEAVLKTIELVNSGKHYLDNRLAAEFCLLQLRYCCEYMAIGFVAIHTDVSMAKLYEQWNAQRILKTFEQLKPEFFPEGVKSEPQPDGTILQIPVEGALTQEELVKMYNFTGEMLHSGTFNRFKTPEAPRSYSFELVNDFILKLTKLLSDHVYRLDDGARMIRVIMYDKNGRVGLNELERKPIPQSLGQSP